MLSRMLRLVVTAGLLSSLAVAATLVAPALDTGTEGAINNFYPFGIGTAEGMRYQQIYAASEFEGQGGPMLITAIGFRPDGIVGYSFSYVLPDVQIDLSTTTATPSALSTTFASNVGADNQIVYSGALSLASAFVGPAGGPKAFDIIIPLTSPFLYIPGNGNLLMDVRNFAGTSSASGITFDADTTSTSIQRVYAIGVNSTDGTGGGARGLVTQFEFTVVPEPAAIWTVGLAIAGLGISKRRRLRQD